jgi:hypothetical protein
MLTWAENSAYEQSLWRFPRQLAEMLDPSSVTHLCYTVGDTMPQIVVNQCFLEEWCAYVTHISDLIC